MEFFLELHWNIEQCVELKLHLFFIIVLLEPWLTHRATNWLSMTSSIRRILILALTVITRIKFNITSQAVFVSDSLNVNVMGVIFNPRLLF